MIKALSVLILLVSAEASAQQSCRQEMGDFVCRNSMGQVISRCRMEMSEYVCRGPMGEVIQRCRLDAFGNMNCR